MEAETTFLLEMAIIMVTAGVISVIFSKLRLPVVIGYLAAGIILGPNLFEPSFVSDMDTIDALANAGIVLLMFTLGLEFTLRRLKKVGLFAALAGSVEIVLMITLGYGLGLAFGWSTIQSIFLGAVMSISSTAVIIKVLSDAGMMKREFAEAIVGILIIEDIAAVIILTLSSPWRPGRGDDSQHRAADRLHSDIHAHPCWSWAWRCCRGHGPHVPHRLPGTLLIVSLGLCFGMAIVASSSMSVAIGAFLVGIIISQSVVQEKVVERITPIKEISWPSSSSPSA